MKSLSDLNVSEAQLEAFCQKWHIIKLEFFGSVLRDDFRPDSDIDVLVTRLPGTRFSLLEHASMQCELEDIFNRKVDVVIREAIERSKNPYRKKEILSSAQVVYAAA